MRYIRQSDTFSCGPIAIMNVAKWIGIRATIKDHHMFLRNLCGTTIEAGTQEHGLMKGLRFALGNRAKVKHRFRPTLASIEGNLRLGRAVILMHSIGTAAFHYILITMDQDGNMSSVNSTRGKTRECLDRTMLKKYLRRFSRAWFIEKVR